MAGIAATSPNTEAVQSLREQVRGRVITAADEGYDEARMVHNGMFDRRPLAVLKAEQVGDVIGAVNFAREHGLDLSVRGGGHSGPGFGTNDGGVVIDMSEMRTVRVDPRNKTARADAGATWGDFNYATHAFGLATTGGIISTTGITGLTLGGGIGYLARGLGLTIDNLISADVVTADGRFLTASERENEDLFWGLRGGGGNFGVVTSLEYRLSRGRSGLRRADLLQPGRRRHRASHVRRVHPGRARGVRRLPRIPDRPAVAVHPGGPARRHAVPGRGALGRPARPGRESPASRSETSRRSLPTEAVRCRIRR